MHSALLVWLMAAQAPMGATIFAGQCAICHGQHGEGGRGPSLARPKLRHAPDDAALQRIIRRGIPGAGMPATWLNEAELAEVAAHVRSLGRVASSAAPASLAGNAAHGETVFRGKGRCAACHTVNGKGGAFGPDLTGIGAKRSAAHLRQSVADPAADVLPEFVLLRAVTRTGRAVTGARVNEDTFSVQMRDAAGVVHSFWKSELRQLRKEPGKTAMPAYGSTLRASELDDLIRYLASLEEEAAQ